jgi:ribosomal protein S18 acetylase RimI-like enzyme
MDVRQASTDDYELCAAIPTSVQTTHVWQLRLTYDPTAPYPADELGAGLYRSRLPRPIIVGPASSESLADLWGRANDVLVAEDEQGIAGYIVLTVEPHAPALHVARLAVAPLSRRARIGGTLLQNAVRWGSAYRFETLVSHCGARNDPAANFFMRWGLRFAGYSESFYPRGEVAMFFQRPL